MYQYLQNKLDRIHHFINRFFLIVAGISILCIMVLGAANVILRLFKIPFSGTYEMVGFFGSILVAFTLSETQRCKDHVMVDFISRKFSMKTIKWLDIFQYSLSIVFFALITGKLFFYGIDTWQSGEMSETLKIAYYPFILSVSLGFALLCFTLVIDLIKTIMSKHP